MGKAHRNGIYRPKKNRFPPMTGVDRKYLRNLRFAKKHNKVVPKGIKRIEKEAMMAKQAAHMLRMKKIAMSKATSGTGKIAGKAPQVAAKSLKRPASDIKKSAPPAKRAAITKKAAAKKSSPKEGRTSKGQKVEAKKADLAAKRADA